MMQKQITEIYQFTRANGNYLETQKVLKQIDKHQDIAWQIICELCSKLKNKNIDNAFSQMVFTLPDQTKHQQSSKWLKDFMNIRDLSLKLGSTYLIMDYLRPEKDKTINLFAKVIEVIKGVNQLKNQFDELVVRDDLTSRQFAKSKILEENTKTALFEITDRKKSERPLYEQKVKVIESIHQQNSQKRQEKIQFLAKQKYFKDEISHEEKKLDQLKYQEQNLLFRIEQIKNQIAQNAPEYKKEKIAVDEEHNRLEKQILTYLDKARIRQNKIKFMNDTRKKSKNEIYEQVNKLIDAFALLEQSKSKFVKLKEENENFKRRKNNVLSLQIDSKQMVKKLEMETQNLRVSKETLERQKKMLEHQCYNLYLQIADVLNRITSHENSLVRLTSYYDEQKQKVEAAKAEYKKERKFSENEVTKWMTMFEKNLNKMFSPMAEINSTLQNKIELRRNYPA